MAMTLFLDILLLEGGFIGISASLLLCIFSSTGLMYAAMKMEIMLFDEGSLLERINRLVLGQAQPDPEGAEVSHWQEEEETLACSSAHLRRAC